MLPSGQHLFQRNLSIFLQDDAKPHSERFTTPWSSSSRVWVPDSCLPAELYGAWWSAKHRNTELLSISRCTSSKNGQEFHFEYSYSYCLQFPDAYWVLLEKKWMLHSRKKCSYPNFSGTSCRLDIQNLGIFQKNAIQKLTLYFVIFFHHFFLW